jgi:excisionase family DNA binding protein
MLRDQDFGVVRLRAFGTYDFKVVEVKRFLKEVAGSDHNFRLDEFADTMRSRLVAAFSDAIASAKVPALDIATRYQEVGEALLPLINPQLEAKYGITVPSFILENCSVPPEVEAAIDKRSSMSAIGNLNDYVKYQMAQGMAQPGAGGGVAGSAAEVAMGFAMAQQMANQPGGFLGSSQPQTGQPPTAPLPEVLTPADVAKALGVTEADVLSTLESGELKGRKIGSAWRVTKGALDEFLG